MPPEVILLGVVIGLGYGAVAVGVVMTFRASRVLNLAQAHMGAFAAALVLLLVEGWGLAYWSALCIAIAVAAGLTALVEVGVVRRLRAAPPLMTVVATLGVAQVLGFLVSALADASPPTAVVPEPPGIGALDVGALRLTSAHLVLLVAAPLTVAALGLVLARTALGRALRAVADSPEPARLMGLRAGMLTAVAWGMAGGIAGLVGPLIVATAGTGAEVPAGAGLLVRTLGAAVLAGLTSLPVALAGGVAIGIVEQVTLWNSTDAGAADLVVLAIVVVAVAIRSNVLRSVAIAGSWTSFPRWRPLPAAVREVPLVRVGGVAVLVAAVVVMSLAGLFLAGGDEARLGQIAALTLVGLSAWVVAGLGGMVSLGQLALAGIGALAVLEVGDATGSVLAGIVAAPFAGALTAAAVALPAARDRGLLLAVVSLAFAVAVQSGLLASDWALGESVSADPLRIGPVDTAVAGQALAFAVAALAAGLTAAWWLARSPTGRRMLAVRDNERAARALGIGPARVRVQAMAAGGALAGLGGAALVQVSVTLTPDRFSAAGGIDTLAVAVLGGLAVVVGPLLGALYVIGVPAFVDLPAAGLAASALGWLVLILYVPGGLAGLLERLRGPAVRRLLWLAGQADAGKREADPPVFTPAGEARARRDTAGPLCLQLEGLSKRFGAVTALDDVTLAVGAGEIVGLVGPNGAGKTTLVELACGFERSDAGRVLLDGERIDALAPERRSRRGLVRTFQHAVLFPTMTVTEALRLAVEQRGGSSRAALDLRARYRLESHGDHQVRQLSTGTRRVLELACAMALRPRVLVLDEPSAGLAHAEIAPLAALLARLPADDGPALLIVEHDLPLLFGLADRVAVLDGGRLIADGAPDVVAADEGVQRRLGARIAGHRGAEVRA